jgi:hypothetical protein
MNKMKLIRLLKESLENGAQYGVMMIGGSIGDKPRPRNAKGYAGMDASFEELFSKEEAQVKAKRMNKSSLSSGEKKYYGLKYVIVPVVDGKFVDKIKENNISEGSISEDTLDRMDELSNIRDLKVFKTYLRILSTDWMQENFSKKDIKKFVNLLIDEI